jgi:uncharacterized membrane-anchored protein
MVEYRRSTSTVMWMAMLLAMAVLIAHAITFWRRYRIGSGT